MLNTRLNSTVRAITVCTSLFVTQPLSASKVANDIGFEAPCDITVGHRYFFKEALYSEQLSHN